MGGSGAAVGAASGGTAAVSDGGLAENGGSSLAPAGGVAGVGAGPDGPDSVWIPIGEAVPWSEVRDHLSILETVAGHSMSDDGNEWAASFEGALATEVELSRPHMAMADAAGDLYIADKEAHAIRKVLVADGTIHTVAGTNVAGDAPDTPAAAREGALSNPNGLWVQPDGTFYILDLDNAKIRKVTPDGQMSTLIKLESLPIGRGLWVAADESEALIAAGTELLRWTPGGGVEVLANGFDSLGMVLRTDDGRTLAGDRKGHRVYSVGPDGTKTAIAGDGTQGSFVEGNLALLTPLNEPRAIWPYGGGLFVGLHDECRVLYIDATGITHLILRGTAQAHGGDGEAWSTPGDKIGELRSLTIDFAGNLILVEKDEGFVRVLRARRE